MTTYNATWTRTVYSNPISMSNAKFSLTGGKYRLKLDSTLLDKNGKIKLITVYIDEKCIVNGYTLYQSLLYKKEVYRYIQ